MRKKKNELVPTNVVEVIDKKKPAAPKSYDYINLPVFADIKKKLNDAIQSAVDNCGEADTNSVAIKFNVERDISTERQIESRIGLDIHAFGPAEASISLSSSRKILSEKVKTDTFTAVKEPDGQTKIEKLQKSLFDKD